MDGTVLVADDDRTIRTVLTQALTRAGCKVHATSSLVTLMRWVDEGKGDLIISDVMMPDGNGIEQIPQIASKRPNLPVIVISAQNTIMTAIKAEEAQAYDYLPKPFDLPDLMSRASKALASKERRAPMAERSGTAAADPEIPLVGRSAVMQTLYRLIARVMNADLPLLITGESGSGKTILSETIHTLSDRRAMPLVIVGPEDLGTLDAADGLIARARGGTLCFDAVEDFPPDAQLRVVGMLDRLPDTPPRVMATTRADLQSLLEGDGFREDLFYRLSGVTLTMPPLRDRVEDIPLLAEHFLTQEWQTGLSVPRLTEEARGLLRSYPWPGNVRQLQNVLRRLVVTASGEEITASNVAEVLGNQPMAEPQMRAGAEKLADSVERHLTRYFDLHGGHLPPPGLYQRILREIEVPLIELSLDATGGNQAKCADLLGINRNTLRKKMTDLDIRVTRRRKLM